MRHHWGTVLIGLLALTRSAVADVTLDLSSTTVERPGDTGRVCVSLATGGQDVAGTQNDLVWDGTCATLDEGACVVAGTHGKQLYSRIQNTKDFRLRALIISLTDLSPIADGPLYCCDFVVDTAPGTCCGVGVANAEASDPRGNRIVDLRTGSTRVCVAAASGSGTPTPTATPRSTANDDDGCQIAPPHGIGAAPWLAALALLLLRRRR